jgi:hypothetical protein
MSTTIKARDMKLADTVRYAPFGWAWNVAIVKQITATDVVLFRPYGTTADFSYTGGVICYIGTEQYTIPLSSDSEYELLERKELK